MERAHASHQLHGVRHLDPTGNCANTMVAVAELELAGAWAIAIALASKSDFTYNPFHVLRIASLTLAFIGTILAFKPFGMYGGASTSLPISTVGFIYAYRKFDPSQVGN